MEEATTFLLSPFSQQSNNRRNQKGGEGRELTFKLPLLPLGWSSTFLSSLALHFLKPLLHGVSTFLNPKPSKLWATQALPSSGDGGEHKMRWGR
jgi:hypothetical protein